MNDEIEILEYQIKLHLDMIEEINSRNHFEANPEVIVEMERAYNKLVQRLQKIKHID
jgi:hypothetical protein